MDILKRKSSLFLSMGSEEPRYAVRCGLQTRARLWNRLQAGFLSVTSSQGALGGDELHTLSAFGRPVGTHRQYVHTQWCTGRWAGSIAQLGSQASQQDPHSKRIFAILTLLWCVKTNPQ